MGYMDHLLVRRNKVIHLPKTNPGYKIRGIHKKMLKKKNIRMFDSSLNVL